MIKLVNVNKVYGSGDSAVHALKDVNLELPEGKFISIVGKSGSGKSTLMNIIGALDSVSNKSEAEVLIGEDDITKLDANSLAKYRNQKIGYIFQSFYLEPTFTVLENVAMPLTIAGMKKSEREEMAKEAINKLGLSEKTTKKASELSGGQKQRVSIARALVSNPDIVLADEPTGNLDSQNGQEVIRLLQEICDDGKTVILVTHNIEDAKKTDIMVEIKDGEISNIIYNDEATKRNAQSATDYDKEGNLIDPNADEDVVEASKADALVEPKAETASVVDPAPVADATPTDAAPEPAPVAKPAKKKVIPVDRVEPKIIKKTEGNK